MNLKSSLTVFGAIAAFSLSLLADVESLRPGPESGFVSSAEARVGRPLTPLSYAGVARRTTRRMIRRSTIYVVTLPPRCATVTINGAPYYQCGATYYQATGGQYVVVYVD